VSASAPPHLKKASPTAMEAATPRLAALHTVNSVLCSYTLCAAVHSSSLASLFQNEAPPSSVLNVFVITVFDLL
jgi:hypothetical protein